MECDSVVVHGEVVLDVIPNLIDRQKDNLLFGSDRISSQINVLSRDPTGHEDKGAEGLVPQHLAETGGHDIIWEEGLSLS